MRLSSASGTNNSTLTAILNTIGGRVAPSGVLPISYNVSLGIGPHTVAIRKTYTVPADKTAVLTGITGFIFVTVAPSVAGNINTSLDLTPNGGSLIEVLHTEIQFSTFNTFHQFSLPCNYVMSAADLLEWRTTDVGTGGLIFYNMSASLVEYDAA